MTTHEDLRWENIRSSDNFPLLPEKAQAVLHRIAHDTQLEHMARVRMTVAVLTFTDPRRRRDCGVLLRELQRYGWTEACIGEVEGASEHVWGLWEDEEEGEGEEEWEGKGTVESVFEGYED